jgi:GNAT superfamily N-acetyltransferase
MTPRVTIRSADTPAALDEARGLFREYETWLAVDLCFQGFEAELAALPGRYAAPAGRLHLADVDGALAGCIALRAFAPGICEMKRLFVRESARGAGAGRELVARILSDAREIGYGAMRLDTLRTPKMAAANRLYETLGFLDIPAYYANPLPDVRYMELDLGARTPGA